MKKYFVSYACYKQHTQGFGNCFIESENPYTQEAIQELENSLRKDEGLRDVVVLNIIPLRNDEE